MATTRVAVAPMKVAQIPKAGADFQIASRRVRIQVVCLSMALRRWVSGPHAFPVSAVCCNEHSRGFGFAMPPPESRRKMGSGLTICDCIPDMR